MWPASLFEAPLAGLGGIPAVLGVGGSFHIEGELCFS